MDKVEEGGPCGFPGCPGRMEIPPVKNCSCHISPPCNACVENPLVCDACGWQEGDPTS